ncbi:MAG TPA: right-handed parallel beta-helix repeat-containing protein [Geobacteraceae bacterium]
MIATTSLRRGLILTALIILVVVSAQRWRAIQEVGKETLTKDTTWRGDIVVTGDVCVPPGITLTIEPGTKIRFRKIEAESDRNLFAADSPYYPQAEIIVTGRLIAKGTPERPILFSSAEGKPKPADWGALNFLGNTANVLENCRIEYAYNGVHAHGAQVLIKNCTLTKNSVAISFKKEEEAKGSPGFGIGSDLVVSGNLIEGNKGGINVRKSSATITHNIIRDNKSFGIYVKEECRGEISRNVITGNKKGIFFYRASGLNITGNDIYDNNDYNLAVADEQEKDITLGSNWYGTTDRQLIEAMIFDQKVDPDMARIVVEPVATARIAGAGR